jgi:hypothetical protein
MPVCLVDGPPTGRRVTASRIRTVASLPETIRSDR